jgi:hypothetical protein
VLDFVLFHELLHKRHGVQARGGRLAAHTPSFRRDEARHPRQGEAECFLSDLARRLRRPA